MRNIKKLLSQFEFNVRTQELKSSQSFINRYTIDKNLYQYVIKTTLSHDCAHDYTKKHVHKCLRYCLAHCENNLMGMIKMGYVCL